MINPAARHELTFWHGHERAQARLVLPRTAGPHPLVVLAGDGADGPQDAAAWVEPLVAEGFAVLTWCRPAGVPSVTDPERRSADHRAELLAALSRAASVPGVDAARVAVVGCGDAAWAAVRAAGFDERIAAVVLVGAPAVTRDRLRAVRGLSPEAPVPDLLPSLSALSAPVLALFGELDDRVPVPEAVHAARLVLDRSGHEDHEVAVVRGADAELRVRPAHGLGGLVAGRHRFGDLPPGLARLVAHWIAARVRRPDVVPSFVPPVGDLVVDVRDPVQARERPHSVWAVPVERRSGAAGLLPPGPPVPVRQTRRRFST